MRLLSVAHITKGLPLHLMTEAVFGTTLHKTPIETRIHFFFQKINCKKKIDVLSAISFAVNEILTPIIQTKLERKYLEKVCNPSSTNFNSRPNCSLNMTRVLHWAFKYGPGTTYGHFIHLNYYYDRSSRRNVKRRDVNKIPRILIPILGTLNVIWIQNRKKIVFCVPWNLIALVKTK